MKHRALTGLTGGRGARMGRVSSRPGSRGVSRSGPLPRSRRRNSGTETPTWSVATTLLPVWCRSRDSNSDALAGRGV